MEKTATQTVFGEGASKSTIMIVGEQPGDQEDRMGRPFVGPAGKLLDDALVEAGIDRAIRLRVTNVVKHFKWSAISERGKRRIHKKPRQSEIQACYPWLEAELHAVRPKGTGVHGSHRRASGAGKARQCNSLARAVTAAESPHAPFAIPTMHPSAILRAVDDVSRQRQLQLHS